MRGGDWGGGHVFLPGKYNKIPLSVTWRLWKQTQIWESTWSHDLCTSAGGPLRATAAGGVCVSCATLRVSMCWGGQLQLSRGHWAYKPCDLHLLKMFWTLQVHVVPKLIVHTSALKASALQRSTVGPQSILNLPMDSIDPVESAELKLSYTLQDNARKLSSYQTRQRN